MFALTCSGSGEGLLPERQLPGPVTQGWLSRQGKTTLEKIIRMQLSQNGWLSVGFVILVKRFSLPASEEVVN